MAWVSFAVSISLGSGALGDGSPQGHGSAEIGRRLVTVTGVNFKEPSPAGKVTHPWLPKYFAVRVIPLGRVM